MYTRITRSGGRSYLQLVEAYRDDAGRPRQKVVATLGRLDQLQPEQLDPLIRGLQRVQNQHAPEPAPNTSGPQVTYESSRAYGDVYALTQLWDALGLRKALGQALTSSRRHFDAETLLRVMVLNRLCNPQSKLGVLRWLETVVLPRLGKPPTHTQLLRTMDALIEQIGQVEAAVCRCLRPHIDASLSVVFYDLTTIRVHGEAQVDGDLRRFGMSKDGGVARQFVLGVVQSAEGIPLMHTVEAGNTAETKTVIPMLRRVLERFCVQRLVVIADRGLLSLDNLDDIEALSEQTPTRMEFVLAVPVRRYGELADQITDLDVSQGVAETRYGERRLIVAYDAEAAARQRQRRREKLDELKAMGQKLADKLDRQDSGKKSRGRKASDRGAYARFYRAVSDAEMTRFLSLDFDAELFTFEENAEAVARAEALDGKLVLITNVKPMDAADVVSRYKALADIERGFRVLKSDLEIGPVYHRLPERIRAHALICFLALLLYRVMRQRLANSKLTDSPRHALHQLRQIQRHRIQIDGRRHAGLGKLTRQQQAIFDALELSAPAR